MDRKDVEPVKQDPAGMSPATTAFARSRFVAARTRTSTGIGWLLPTRSISRILKDAEQGDLGFRRQIADFVEENRATVGGFESPQTVAAARPLNAPFSWP